jgi:hypothetical protein
VQAGASLKGERGSRTLLKVDQGLSHGLLVPVRLAWAGRLLHGAAVLIEAAKL